MTLTEIKQTGKESFKGWKKSTCPILERQSLNQQVLCSLSNSRYQPPLGCWRVFWLRAGYRRCEQGPELFQGWMGRASTKPFALWVEGGPVDCSRTLSCEQPAQHTSGRGLSPWTSQEHPNLLSKEEHLSKEVAFLASGVEQRLSRWVPAFYPGGWQNLHFVRVLVRVLQKSRINRIGRYTKRFLMGIGSHDFGGWKLLS